MKILFNILFFLAFILPSYTYTYLFIIVGAILFSFFNFKSFNFSHQKFIFLAVFFIALSSNILSNNLIFLSDIDLIKNFLLLIIVMLLGNYNTYSLNSSIILTIIGLLIFSQLTFVFDLTFFKNIIDNFYPVEDRFLVWTHRSIDSIQDLIDINIRAGGIFRNPNQYSKYLNLLFIVYLNKHPKFNRAQITLILIILVSILLTGSRTGFFVFFFILTLKLKYEKYNILPFLVLIPTVFALDLYFNFRSLDLFFDESLANRIPVIDYIFFDSSSLGLLLGNFYGEESISSKLSTSFMFDSDLLSLLYSFGIAGIFILCYIFYRLTIYSGLKYVFPIFLYAITGGVFFDIRFLLVLYLVLSFYKPKSENLI